jgi:hypothetical protein
MSFFFFLFLFFAFFFSFPLGPPLAKEEHLESDDAIQPTLPIRLLPMQIVLQSSS